MKNEKMSLEKMRSVLSHVLSREEMKQVMAGSGGGPCGTRCMKGGDHNAPCFITLDGCVCGTFYPCFP